MLFYLAFYIIKKIIKGFSNLGRLTYYKCNVENEINKISLH